MQLTLTKDVYNQTDAFCIIITSLKESCVESSKLHSWVIRRLLRGISTMGYVG